MSFVRFGNRNLDERDCQKCKYCRLHQRHERLKQHYRHRQDQRDERGCYRNKNPAGKDVTEQPERKRDEARQIAHKFYEPDAELKHPSF